MSHRSVDTSAALPPVHGPSMRRLVRVLCLACLFIALASPAYANGVYIPQPAYPVLPTIPVQRAVIIHRNNTETLIVESAFESKSPEVAWILPLPAAPTKLSLAEPGAVSSTASSLRPKIIHDLHNTGLPGIPLTICVLTAPLVLVTIFKRDYAARRSAFKCILYLEILLGFFSAILLPSLGTAGIPSVDLPGLSILSTQRLGDADFTVLNATTPGALDQWLTGQSLRPLDAAAKPIVADYIAHHWCFVVGKLHNNTSALAVPRPLMATFPATEAVFPMKLTALANTTTHVELCIIANQQAAAPGFHCVIADQFTRQPAQPDSNDYSFQAAYSAAEHTSTALGHPDIVPLLWDQCTATKLIADLSPAKMDHDITLQFHPFTPHQDILYTSLARLQITGSVLACGLTIFLIMAAVFLRGRRQPTRGEAKSLLAWCAAAFAIAGSVWLFFPTIPVYVSNNRARFGGARAMSGAARILADQGTLSQNMTPAQINAIPQLMLDRQMILPQYVNNPYTGQPLRAECSPGNFALRTINNKTYFCTYDENGIEQRTLLP